MKKVAIVVQRCHEAVVGGSESLAWHYATLLKDTYHVDLLTTTALDISDWANVLPEGPEEKEGINLVRFPVTVGRNAYWAELQHRLSCGFDPFTPGRRRNSEESLQLKWSVPLQEEFIKNQGPYSAPLMDFIKHNWRNYQSIMFVTYLYPTTYFGLQQLPPGNALFVPTLHDEQPAYLSAYKHAAVRARALVWLTEAESRVSQKLWGDLPGRVIGMAIDTEPREPEISHIPYLLYCGRVDPNKGCAQLFEFYFKFKRATRSKLRLVITGTADMEIPPHADIDFRGFVPREEKFRLMSGAAVYVVPSPNESFSIVTLEAMAQQTPVLASGRSEVMVDHVNRSGAGRIYCDYESFEANLRELLADGITIRELGTKGREYATRHYTAERVRGALIDLLDQQRPVIEAQPRATKKPVVDLAEPADRHDPVSTIVRNAASSSPASHTLTLQIGEHVHKISLNLYSLGKYPGEHLFVRPMTHDSDIVEGVASLNEYALPKRFTSEAIVIDIGAHVGAFSYAALSRGASKVYAYEAHPANHAIAFHNLAKFGGKAVCRNAAVWRSDETEQVLYNDPLTGLNKLNTGGISVLWNNEGIPVPTVSLDELLREASNDFTRPIRLLKLDCEGSEYPILFTSKHLEIVQEICGEYHEIEAEHVPARAQIDGRSDRFNREGLREYLEDQGFSVQLDHNAENLGVFHANRNPEVNRQT